MAVPKIKFEPSVPKGAREELKALIAPNLAMLDGEVKVLRVGLKTGADVGEDGEASTMTLRRYHFAVVALDPSFFGLSGAEKRQVITHECVHILHALYSREVEHILQHLMGEEVQNYVFSRLCEAEERVVNAFADALDIARARGVN